MLQRYQQRWLPHLSLYGVRALLIVMLGLQHGGQAVRQLAQTDCNQHKEARHAAPTLV